MFQKTQAYKPTELTANELAHVVGGDLDGDWCGTKYPGWHPPVPGPELAFWSERQFAGLFKGLTVRAFK